MGSLGFSFLDFVDSSPVYFYLSLVCRVVQGFGDITIQTCCKPCFTKDIGYSILSTLFAEKKEKVMGYAETAVGVGLVTGPILGVTMYNSLGYFTCYIILSVLLGVSVLLMQILMPASLNETNSSNEESTQEKPSDYEIESDKASQEVKYSWFLHNRRAIFALASVSMYVLVDNFKSAYMPVVIEYTFGIEE